VSSHRHSLGHEHEIEPQHGLPEALPASERLLWQGSPQRLRIALDVFHLRAVAVYFAVLLALRFLLVQHDTGSVVEAVAATTWAAAIFALGLGLLWLLADLTARTTVYTITNRRVVMRIGIVLSLTFNLPFTRIVAAQVRRRADGSGDLVFELSPEDKIAYVHLWPHARPWRLSHPQPMLRSIAAIDAPAALLTEAWLAVQPPTEPVQVGPARGVGLQPIDLDRPQAA
jgi:hypothetical protein